MSGAYKIRVPENYRPLGVNNEVRFYFNRKSAEEKFFVKIMSGGVHLPSAPPPVGSRKIKKFFRENLAFVLKTKLPHGDNVVFRANIVPDERTENSDSAQRSSRYH